MNQVNILIVGTGLMAQFHVKNYQRDPRVKVVGAVDVEADKLKGFCDKFQIARSFTSLDEAIVWNKFDAVANCTPDRAHHPTTMALISAGKAILCEKPLAESYPLALDMAKGVAKAKLVNMVNLSYRDVPALTKARALIGEGVLGEVRHVEASYRQSWLVGNHWGQWSKEPLWLWRLSQNHGSRGVLGDVGIHILDFVAYAIDMLPETLQARLATFHKAPNDRIGEYQLDANDSAVMSVSFANGALGIIHASRFMTGYENTLKLQVFGTKGALEIEHGVHTSLRLCDGDNIHVQAWREIAVDPVDTNYQRFVSAVLKNEPVKPDFAYAAQLQQILDRCFDGDCARAPSIL